MRKAILEQLSAIEREHDVRIIMAVEAGSRALGYASDGSDYDVRFIYVHRAEWYLSISPSRDVIEMPVSETFDCNGWDIRKALQLARKSNISVSEWLHSPIVYRVDKDLVQILRRAMQTGFQPAASGRHYLSIARNNMHKTSRDVVRTKWYLCTVRPLLCCRWVLERASPPPMAYRELLNEFLADSEVGRIVHELLDEKQANQGSVTMCQHPALDEFTTSEYSRLSTMCSGNAPLADEALFDNAFRAIIANTKWL